MKKILFLMVSAICAWCAAAVPASDFDPKLPRRAGIGKTPVMTLDASTHVVVAPGAGATERFAASELAEFLGRALGVKIAVTDAPKPSGVALSVGDNLHSRALGIDVGKFDRDGFAIRSGKNLIAIAGRDGGNGDPALMNDNYFEHATLFGVYDFLERFAGIRFYFPGKIGEVVPKTEKIPLGTIDIYERPDHFQRRSGEFYNPWYDPATAKGGPVLQDYRRRSQTFYVPCCHSLERSGYFRRFAQSHPEYFAVDPAGKIYSADHWSVGSGCYLSPGFRNEIFLDALSALKGEPPEKRGMMAGSDRQPLPGFRWDPCVRQPGFFSVMPGDHHRRCLCDKCKSYMEKSGENEYVWNLICDVAGRVEKAKLPGKITAMAYARYTEVPKQDIPGNVEVMVAVIGPWAERNAGFRNSGDDRIRNWCGKLGRKVWLWTYPHKLNGAGGAISLAGGAVANPGIPQMAPRSVGNFFKRQAPYTFGAYYEAESDRWIFNYLNSWIFFKLAWDNSADVDQLIDEHHRVMFGAAAKEMERFYAELENLWMNRMLGNIVETELGPVNTPPAVHDVWEKIYSPGKLAGFDALFQRAEKLVSGETLLRVKFIRKHFLEPLKAESERYFREKEALADWSFFVKPLAAGERIAVDGKPDDPAWKNAEPIFPLPLGGGEVEVKTQVRGRSDDQFLYFLAECGEPRMKDVVARQTERDHKDLWQDSVIEIMLNPSGDGRHYRQFIINSAGVVGDLADERLGASSKVDGGWNSGVKAAATRGDDRFFIEVAIPKSDLKGFDPDKVKANFCRHRALTGAAVKERFYSWSPNRAGFHEVEKFGALRFTPQPEKNLIKNGAFTRKFSGTWTPSSYKPDGPVLDDKYFIVGGQSAKIVSDGKFHWLFQSLPLKSNTTYAVSFFLKMEDVKPLKQGGGLQVLLGDNRNNYVPPTPYTGSMPWSRQGFFWTTGPDGGKEIPGRSRCIRFGLRDASGSVWIDDVKFVEIAKQ